ncbi:hypothetical protein DFQ26_001200 [Actinomortierella ambigua]|nr:hypothetical protein DFQ26_001200 [Actinomortierella ambigua]
MLLKKIKDLLKPKKTSRQRSIEEPTSAPGSPSVDHDGYRWQTFDRSEVSTTLPPLDLGIATATGGNNGMSSSTSSASASTPHRGVTSSISSAGSSGAMHVNSSSMQPFPIANKFKKGYPILSSSLPSTTLLRDKPLPVLPGSSNAKANLSLQQKRKSVPLFGLRNYKDNGDGDNDVENDGDDEKDDGDDDLGSSSVNSTITGRRVWFGIGSSRQQPPQRAMTTPSVTPDSGATLVLPKTQRQSRPDSAMLAVPEQIDVSSRKMRPEDIASIKSIQIPYGRIPPSLDSQMENHVQQQQQQQPAEPSAKQQQIYKANSMSQAEAGSSKSGHLSETTVPQSTSTSATSGNLANNSPPLAIGQSTAWLASKSSPALASSNPEMKVHPNDLIESSSMPDVSFLSMRDSAQAAQASQAATDSEAASYSQCATQAPVSAISTVSTTLPAPIAATNLSPMAVGAATAADSGRHSVGFHSSTGNRSSRHSAHRIIYQDDLVNNRVQLPLHGDYEIVPGSSEDGPLGAGVSAGTGANIGVGTNSAGGSDEAYLAQEAQRNRVVIRPSLTTGRVGVFPVGHRSSVTTPVTIGGGNGGFTVRVVHAGTSPAYRSHSQSAYPNSSSSGHSNVTQRKSSAGQASSSVPSPSKRKG